MVERRPDLEYLLISHSRIGISRRWRCVWIRYPIRIFSHAPDPSQDPSWARKNPEILGMGVGKGVDQIFGTSTDLVFAIWPLIEGVSAEGGWWKIIS